MLVSLLIAGATLAPLKNSAWLVFYDPASMASFEKYGAQLSEVGVEWIVAGPDGLPKRREHATPANAEKVRTVAKRHGVTTYAMTSNAASGGFDASLVDALLKDEASMRAHAEALAQLAKDDGFDGVDLDYESMRPAVREPYVKFAAMVREACDRRQLKLAIAVHAKTSEPGNWDGPISQDWKALGALVDRFRIMTYDFHWATSEAGPIAPLEWFDQVIAFAKTQVAAEKIEAGVASYGYDWKDKSAKSITWRDWQELTKLHTWTQRDAASQENTVEYDGRKVFFSDAVAIRAKFDLAAKAGVRGVAMWRLGSEDPAVWDFLGRRP